MKKQLLLPIVAIFALFFFSSANAQNTAFDPPSCIATALTPAIGGMYNYAATISGVPSYTGNGNFKWYVTKNVNLITGVVENAGAADDIVASGTAYNTSVAGPGGNNINILWTAKTLATGAPYYLVVRYEEPNVSGTSTCTAMNMKVYRIIPKNYFWLKIESVDASGVAGGVDQCAADVIAAVITEPAGTVEYTYGQNVLYVKISANGYVGTWTPTLRLSGLVADQVISGSNITWSSGAASGIFTCSGACTNGNGDYVSNNPMPSTISATGSEIIVTIPIDNRLHEALANQTIAVAIDGSFVSGANTFNDLSNVNGPCTPETAFADAVDKIIKARPAVAAVNPNTLVPASPAPLP